MASLFGYTNQRGMSSGRVFTMRLDKMNLVFNLVICVGLICSLMSLSIIITERDTYKEEVTRQEKVINIQYGKMCMLDGILRNEIPKFTLDWVDLSEHF